MGDCQIKLACEMFVEQCGKELLRRNLFRNLVLHMSNLQDFGLIDPMTISATLERLRLITAESHSEWQPFISSCQRQLTFQQNLNHIEQNVKKT